MKVLSIQQPWASLIAAGIKDVENRSWKPKILPDRVLIHASKKCTARTVSKLPIEWVQEILNEQMMGNLPEFSDMPSGAIIGYFSIGRINKKTEGSVWASGSDDEEDTYYWHLNDCYLFDEPILGVKGKLNLWDYEIDENNLPPAHQIPIEELESDEDHVYLPIQDVRWQTLGENQDLFIELGIVASEVLCKPGVYDLKDFNTITFCNNGEERSFRLTEDTYSVVVTDSDREPEKYLSILEPNGAKRWVARFAWAEEINNN